MNKGLDSTFMHYGIRREDMRIIQTICEENDVNFEWFQEYILKEFHSLKMKNEERGGVGLQRGHKRPAPTPPRQQCPTLTAAAALLCVGARVHALLGVGAGAVRRPAPALVRGAGDELGGEGDARVKGCVLVVGPAGGAAGGAGHVGHRAARVHDHGKLLGGAA